MSLVDYTHSQYLAPGYNDSFEMEFVKNKWFRTAVKNCFGNSESMAGGNAMFDESLMEQICKSILRMLTTEIKKYNQQKILGSATY